MGMQHVIIANGHLIMDGTETIGDLRTALTYLYQTHTSSECQRPEFGIPIEELITNMRAITVTRTKRPHAITVDMSKEFL